MVDTARRSADDSRRMKNGCVVFAGPCLSPEPDAAWRGLLDRVDLRPPARRGDVLTALASDPHTLVLLDGYYYAVPAVTHKELLYALEAGVRVLGAASLGALRAAEMASFGMEGVGEVYDAFASGALDGDDEVAVVHLGADRGYRATSVALVEVRAALERLGVTGGRLVDALKRLPFTERHTATVVDLAVRHLGAATAAALSEELGRRSVKRDDARRALELALDGTPEAPPRRAGTAPATSFFSLYRESSFRAVDNGDGAGEAGEVELLRAWNVFQLLHPAAPSFVREIRRRFIATSAATDAGLEPAPDDLEAEVDALAELLAAQGQAALLPRREIVAEARDRLLAEAATARFGGPGGAARHLAADLGLPPEHALAALTDLLETEPEQLPAWRLMRAFVFTEALEPAIRAARSAGDVHRCFLSWASGARVAPEEIPRLAAGLWGCRKDAVSRQAARRGFFPAGAGLPGFEDAVRFLAPAERLKRPINDYPLRRDALRAAPWAPHAAGESASADRRELTNQEIAPCLEILS